MTEKIKSFEAKYVKIVQDFKPVFGNLKHIEAARLISQINKTEADLKLKQRLENEITKELKNVLQLKKQLIYLLK